ncbi:DnaJ domain-containing protein [Flavobacterium subsaxonicum]|uniref:J domain-containing protein n=1 Tax=Flavobacterium subsaxonicum WB 4.1-42 = DSM 21790 TaxID=1121898 RepID=A0A0A2MU28_9FLAO|nr:DnaJ domain-containing protein [Flavobacterium subsaxonicum]KGO94983.1 hypothetical protein Q766_02410 [Flavobacterium subsaxonicum WB 4.1-42 = DSM 21790]
MKDYYKILGVKHSASQAEIKKAYRLLAVAYHPDKNNGDKASEDRFKEISESYIILGDFAKRNAYDYTAGHQKNYRGQNIEAGKPTPITYLLLFKRIKDKVLHANGNVDKNNLFKVVDDLLTDDTIGFLIRVQDIATNNLIIDEILTCCIFLEGSLKASLYIKLKKLANGDVRFTEKVTLLNKQTDYITIKPTANSNEESLSKASVIMFVVFLLFFIVLIVVAGTRL